MLHQRAFIVCIFCFHAYNISFIHHYISCSSAEMPHKQGRLNQNEKYMQTTYVSHLIKKKKQSPKLYCLLKELKMIFLLIDWSFNPAALVPCALFFTFSTCKVSAQVPYLQPAVTSQFFSLIMPVNVFLRSRNRAMVTKMDNIYTFLTLLSFILALGLIHE